MTFRHKNNWTIIAVVSALLIMAWVIPVSAIPIADFTATPPLSGAIPLTVQFNDASSGIGTLAHAWDFGDGGTSTVTNPAHQYTVAGLYTVTLTVTDDDGPTNSSTKTIPDYITIYAEPVAAFTNATPRSGTTTAYCLVYRPVHRVNNIAFMEFRRWGNIKRPESIPPILLLLEPIP